MERGVRALRWAGHPWEAGYGVGWCRLGHLHPPALPLLPREATLHPILEAAVGSRGRCPEVSFSLEGPLGATASQPPPRTGLPAAASGSWEAEP